MPPISPPSSQGSNATKVDRNVRATMIDPAAEPDTDTKYFPDLGAWKFCYAGVDVGTPLERLRGPGGLILHGQLTAAGRHYR